MYLIGSKANRSIYVDPQFQVRAHLSLQGRALDIQSIRPQSFLACSFLFAVQSKSKETVRSRVLDPASLYSEAAYAQGSKMLFRPDAANKTTIPRGTPRSCTPAGSRSLR
jgi:hypothetical protein